MSLGLPSPQHSAKPHPNEWPPALTDNDDGTLTLTTPPEPGKPGTPTDDDLRRIFAFWDLDPEAWVILDGTLRPNAWNTQGPDGLVLTMRQYKATLVPAHTLADLDTLLAAVRRHRPRKPTLPKDADRDGTFVFAVADPQIGKGAGPEGDSTEAIVQRILDGADQAIQRLPLLRRRYRLPNLILANLGDTIEGVSSSYSAQPYVIDLGLTQQIEVASHVQWELLRAFAPLFERIDVPTVPGNHTEIRAFRGGDLLTSMSDSYDLLIPALVQQAIRHTEAGGFDHVHFWQPPPDTMHLTLPIEGCPVAFAHGQQFGNGANPGGKALDWWRKQAFAADNPIRDAKVLMVGHMHHFRQITDGDRTLIMLPSPDNGSPNFTEKSGQHTPPGVTSMIIDPEERWPVQELVIHSA